MLSGGVAVGDGSWTLTVFVTDLQVERRLRVKGDLHIGGVMIRLVDELGKTREKLLQSKAQWLTERLRLSKMRRNNCSVIHYAEDCL